MEPIAASKEFLRYVHISINTLLSKALQGNMYLSAPSAAIKKGFVGVLGGEYVVVVGAHGLELEQLLGAFLTEGDGGVFGVH
jgi:hypothetical protein